MITPLLLIVLLFHSEPSPPPKVLSGDDPSTEITERDEQVWAFANEIAIALNERNGKKVSEAFDLEALLDRVFDYEGALPGARLGFSIRFKKIFRVGESLCERSFANEGAWSEPVLYWEEGDGGYAAVIRVVHSKSSIEYLIFHVIPRGEGWAIADVSFSGDPETQSEFVRRLLILKSHLTDSSTLRERTLQRDELRQLRKQEKWEELLLKAETFEQAHGASLHVQSSRIAAFGKLGRLAEMKAVVKDALEQYPLSINPPMDAFSLLTSEKKYEEALHYVDLLDEWIEGDPYLEFIRGVLYSALGKKEIALEHFERCSEEDPLLYEPYNSAAKTALALKEWGRIVRALAGVEEHFDLDFTHLSEAESWQGFFSSDEGKEWFSAWKLRREERAKARAAEGEKPAEAESPPQPVGVDL